MATYTVNSPLKWKGERIASGDVEMTEKQAAPLIEMGVLTPKGETKAAPDGKKKS